MADDGLEGRMSDRLEELGLTGKKLALFGQEASANIASQLCKEMGIICEQWHVDWVSELIQNAKRGEPFAKRLRGDHEHDPLHPSVLDHLKNAVSRSAISSSQVQASVELSLHSRPTRRLALDAEAEGAREKRETEQKEIWSRELYLELKRLGAPSLEHLEHCVPDRHLHLALAGRTRYNTLKRYVKTWKGFIQWLTATKGYMGYPEPGDLVEYLFSRYDEPCGPTIPGLIVKAVTWMERTAGWDPRQRIGETHIVSSVRDYIVEVLSKDSPPTRRAPRYPVVFAESLETMVENDKLRMGYRAIAWIKLVKLWAALRWDDVQKINPKDLKYYAGRMTTILRVTKTTGPTKRVQELPVCVSEHAYVTSPFWLKTGFDLFKKEATFDRDYMLPKLNAEMTAFRRVMANYNDVTSYSSLVRRTAMRPGSNFPLIPKELAAFWTEHSERATLPTGLALLRAPRDERDMLGRWKPDGSDTYIRMYNGVIARLQLQFAKASREQDRTLLLDERDIVESATSWLTDRCNPASDEELGRLLEHLEQSLKWGAQAGWDIPEDPGVSGSEETAEQQAPPLREVLQEQAVLNKESRKPLYVVVNNGTRCKRLHKSKEGCWMGREMTFKSSVEYYELPDPTLYTHFCKVCWPKGRDNVPQEGSSESSSTSSSNSASSSQQSSDTD